MSEEKGDTPPPRKNNNLKFQIQGLTHMLKRFNLVVGNVKERLDRVKGWDNNNDGWKNMANWNGNHNRRPERHVNHNLDDFDDEEDVIIGDDDFKHEIVGNGDGF